MLFVECWFSTGFCASQLTVYYCAGWYTMELGSTQLNQPAPMSHVKEKAKHAVQGRLTCEGHI